MLEIKDLHASINGKEILKGINLTIRDGEVHALMGQNGAGKSTLSNVLVGHPAYEVTRGSITFNGKDLLAMSPEDRAHEGIFLSFQAPVEIPGVSMANFMKMAVNEQRKFRGEKPLAPAEFLKLVREKSAIVELDSKLISRSVNEGFSGGEKKKNEIFQMAMLERSSPCSTRPTAASRSTRCGSWPPAWPSSSVPITRRSSSRTTNGCSITSHPISCTYFTKDAL